MGAVLIIDAEEDFAAQLAGALRQSGVETFVTGDGKAGLDLAHINIPEAIVLCVELPGMSGYSICTKLKKDTTLKSVPLIITSAEATQETFEHHKKLKTRAEEYLKKPFDPSDLVDVLGRYVTLGPSNGAAVEEGEDLAIEDVPPAVLPDDEAFSGEDFPIDESPPAPRGGGSLMGGVGLGLEERGDGDEALTTVGMVPPGVRDAASNGEVSELRTQIRAEQEARAKAERERDQAISNERALQAQLQAVSSSSVPSSAPSGGREALALKKELSAKDHELVELKEKLNAKEKELLAHSDKEMDLEGRIVGLEEQVETLERTRSDLSGKLAAAETRANETQRTLGGQVEDLNRRLGETSAHENELDGALQAMTQEAETLREDLGNRQSQNEQLSMQVRALTSELTRVTNELTALHKTNEKINADLSQLQNQLKQTESARSQLESDLTDTRGELESTRAELEATRTSLSEAEERVSGAFERIREHEKRDGQIRRALDFALKMLPEPESEALPEVEIE